MTAPTDPNLSVQAVATRLGLQKSAVYDLIRTGKLRGYKLGGAVRVAERDLIRFIEASVIVPAGQDVGQPKVRAAATGADVTNLYRFIKPKAPGQSAGPA